MRAELAQLGRLGETGRTRILVAGEYGGLLVLSMILRSIRNCDRLLIVIEINNQLRVPQLRVPVQIERQLGHDLLFDGSLQRAGAEASAEARVDEMIDQSLRPGQSHVSLLQSFAGVQRLEFLDHNATDAVAIERAKTHDSIDPVVKLRTKEGLSCAVVGRGRWSKL